jgi:hypothetical protein
MYKNALNKYLASALRGTSFIQFGSTAWKGLRSTIWVFLVLTTSGSVQRQVGEPLGWRLKSPCPLDQGFDSQQGQEICLQNAKTNSEFHPTSYSVGPRVLSWG